MNRIIVSITKSLLVGLIFCASPVLAQDALPAIAISIPALENEVEDSSVICTYGDTYIPCSSPHAINMFGIVTAEPLIQIEDGNIENPISVVQNGQVNVRVSSVNGPIVVGDRLTSSNIPGVAQKATEDGPMLGYARQSYSSDDPNATGTILVTLDFDGEGNALSQAKHSLDSVPTFLRALLAGIVVLITFSLSLWNFKHASQSGIEAIGRNPLAKNSIQLGLITNYITTAVFAFLGLVAAYVIVVIWS